MITFLRKIFSGRNLKLADAISNGSLVIDVRSQAEFRGGHASGSRNIPLQELKQHLDKLPKDAPVVFCCASGMRSASAASLARKEGINAINGGSWTSVQRVMRPE